MSEVNKNSVDSPTIEPKADTVNPTILTRITNLAAKRKGLVFACLLATASMINCEASCEFGGCVVAKCEADNEGDSHVSGCNGCSSCSTDLDSC